MQKIIYLLPFLSLSLSLPETAKLELFTISGQNMKIFIASRASGILINQACCLWEFYKASCRDSQRNYRCHSEGFGDILTFGLIGIHITWEFYPLLSLKDQEFTGIYRNLPESSHQSGSSPFWLFLCRNRTVNYWEIVKYREIHWAVTNRTCISSCIVDYFLSLNIFMQTCSRLNLLFCCRATDQSAPDWKCMAKFKTLVRANLWIIL